MVGPDYRQRSPLHGESHGDSETGHQVTGSQVGYSLVLSYLTRSLYEPMVISDTKYLTRKTVFSHTEGWRDMVLNFDPSFVAKTQNLGDLSTREATFLIPALAPSVEQRLPIARSVQSGPFDTTWIEWHHSGLAENGFSYRFSQGG